MSLAGINVYRYDLYLAPKIYVMCVLNNRRKSLRIYRDTFKCPIVR